MVARIKKNDEVEVIMGKDRGKRGQVIQVLPTEDKVMVKGIGLVVRHIKPRRQGEAGGIRKEESFIVASKLMPVCRSCNLPCRVQSKMLDDGVRKRMCGKCKEMF
jgi:large subunit ribosomal protein L24